MLVVNTNSQLGNQMFQYALYRKLIHQGRKVKLDLSYYNQHPEHYGLDIFNLSINKANAKEIAISKDEYRSFLSRLRRRLFGKRNCIINEIDTQSMAYNDSVFKLRDGYLYGYWQSERYFNDIRHILLSEFQFSGIKDERNEILISTLHSTTSVSIHIRRGDYLNGFPLMSKDYYVEAMDYFTKKYNQVYFVVFSNDMQWAKENVIFENGMYVEWNTGKESYIDMYLMTQCKHNIIANSSFSWWGAWLNQNMKKEVIAPSKWFFHRATPDVYCKGWIIINA